MKIKKVSVFLMVVIFHIVVLGVVYLSTRPKTEDETIPGKPSEDVVEKNDKPKPSPENGDKPKPPSPDNNTGADSSKVMIHTVMKGEFLGKIASKYNVTVKEIMDLNKIKDPNKILPGHKLKIPSKK